MRSSKTCVQALRKKYGMLTYGVAHLHDNVDTHRDAHRSALPVYFNLELFDHRLYSPDLAPSDYYLFTYPKKWLRSQSFNSDEVGSFQNMVELTDLKFL
jgi:hypothetical protein